MSPRIFAAAVGFVLIFVGIVVLAIGTTMTDPNGYGTLDCGSAFSPNTEKLVDDANVGELTDAMLGLPGDAEPMAGVQSCQDALSTRHMFGWPLGGLGVLLIVGALFVGTNDAPPPMPGWRTGRSVSLTPASRAERLANVRRVVDGDTGSSKS